VENEQKNVKKLCGFLFWKNYQVVFYFGKKIMWFFHLEPTNVEVKYFLCLALCFGTFDLKTNREKDEQRETLYIRGVRSQILKGPNFLG
jgi:hypothetical protein